jgi:hypothetical protein
MDDAFVDGCGLPRQVKREAHGFSRVGQVTDFNDKTTWVVTRGCVKARYFIHHRIPVVFLCEKGMRKD